jgi:uncharacterized membrane protein YphA (DoxX/SURF4 family)
MNSLTRIFLVLLRLAIGWHFFFEGVEKLNSLATGPTTTNRPFTSADYLGESTGPFARFFRDQARESDEAILDKLTVAPLSAAYDSTEIPPHRRMSPALQKEWDEEFDHLAERYQLDSRQRALAQKKWEQAKDNTVNWLLTAKSKVKITFPTGIVEVEETIPQRIEDYRNKVKQIREMEANVPEAFGRDVLKEKLRTAKAEAKTMRMELLADLDRQKEAALASLQEVQTSEQKSLAVAAKNPASPVRTIDLATSWALTIIGACLLLGLFTRLACVGGASFLLLLYLSMPPFPWLPEPPRPPEGHYLFVSKNLIEMIALLALATTRSGQWAGMDGLLQFLNPWRRRLRSEENFDRSTATRDQERVPVHGH